MKNYYEKSCKQVREFFLGILSFSFCGPREVKSEWLRKNWSQTQDVTPAVALETLPPWSKTRLCHLFFGEGKGRGIQHFTFTTIVYKIEETLRVIEHLSAYNNWKMGGGGVSKDNWPWMIKHCPDLGGHATQSHTLKILGEKRQSCPYMHKCRLFQIQVTLSAVVSASMKLNLAMNWVIAVSVLIIVTRDLYTAHTDCRLITKCVISGPCSNSD